MKFQIVLYVVMILTVFVMIWANMQYKTKGVPWGRPLAGLCGLIALVLAATAMVWHFVGGSWGNTQLRKKEEKYQYIAYKFMGEAIAKRHPGAKLLMIKYPSGAAEASLSMNKAQMDGLKEGMAGKASILREHELTMNMPGSGPGGGSMPEGMVPMMDPGMMLTADKFDEIIDNNPDCNVVLSLVGLPYDVRTMKFWEKAKDGQAPALVLVNAHIYELKAAIKLKYITAVLQNKPEVYDWQAPVPEDETVAFNNRFIIITPENVEETAAKYSQLFMTEESK